MVGEGQVVEVAVKQLAPPLDWAAATHEASVMEEMSGKWYTLPFYGLHRAELPASDGATKDAEDCAYLVMG